MNRSEKDQIIADVAGAVGRARGLYFTDFTGLTVAEATELRREFQKSGVEYRVVKNTLIRKALESVTGFDRVYDSLVGPTGVVFAYEDPVVPAKVIKKFADKHKKLSLKVCVLEHEVFEGARLDDLATIPTRPELIASVLGSIESPLAGVPNVIQAVLRELVSVIGEIEKKKKAA